MKSLKGHMINESKMKDIATIKIGMKDADFWITRRGSMDEVGRPTKTYNKEAYGIKVDRTDIIVPDFLYYAIMNIHMQGYFKQYAKGTLSLVNIGLKDINNIQLG